MTDFPRRCANKRLLEERGLYDPAHERDACGVGFVAQIQAKPSREIVALGLKALQAVWHRGATAADGKTGDGAGLRIAIAGEFFHAQVAGIGHEPRSSPVGVGQIFLPRTDVSAQDKARALVEAELLAEGYALYGWRQTPVDVSVIGAAAAHVRPEIEQVLFHDPHQRDDATDKRALYLVRRRMENRARALGLQDFYVCSLSQRDVIYKGMFLAEQIAAFYPDLNDPRLVSHFVMFHQRYSTNTFPKWGLAQPFRALAHNGEINTIRGNANWMNARERRLSQGIFGEAGADVIPVIQPGASDSAALDHVFELMLHTGADAPGVKAMMLPEAWSKRDRQMSAARRAMYHHANAVMEPWDGPAAIAAFDGRWAVAGLDRNGLRPLRWSLTEDDVLAVGSETGMCPLPEDAIIERGAIGAGAMIAVDFENRTLLRDDALIEGLAAEKPYAAWLSGVQSLDAALSTGAEPQPPPRETLLRRQLAAGVTLEDCELILRVAVESGKEAIGSMGDDTPLAVLSEHSRPLYHFFRQNFAQVTNPPIDPLREARVMSLKTRFRTLPIVNDPSAPVEIMTLESPILTNAMFDRLSATLAEGAETLDATFPVPARPGDGAALRDGLEALCDAAEAAVRAGRRDLILTDHAQCGEKAAIPPALAVGAVQARLVAAGLRRRCSLTVQAGDALDSHACAVLIGVGATAVNPYVAFDAIADMQARGLLGGLSARDCATRYKDVLDAGLMKIMAKLGISVISSYRGGCNFEALGLSRTLVATYFTGVTSRISGLGLAGLEAQTCARSETAWREDALTLPVGGFYRQRAQGERHVYEAELIHALQTAARTRDEAAYERYVALTRNGPPAQLRDLLKTVPAGPAVPLDDVESANAIRRRFVTPGMSLGALSPEAHGALNIAMNRIGAKSVSGEGGEDPARYARRPNGDNANSAVKQVASGRFGVTARYLNECREIEIKVAQGAKPGEGGQLPGFKVTEYIAKLRCATPGTTLISPPPHHDIYSIEDLAQLIYDLKQINPDAEVCVKLVAGAGVGAVAAGVAKAKADVILLSGHVGGTGASPHTSIKFAGLPWEMGLAEAHQVLSLNDLRHLVKLRVDGGFRTGRDVIIGAMLGAEEFGIGTASLVAMGCLMVRQCHSNTCPVGVCTQDEALRARFRGDPEHVVNLMTLIAQDVRVRLAELGARSLTDVIGRCDLLQQIKRGGEHLDDLDLNPLLVSVDPGPYPPRRAAEGRTDVPDTLDAQILADAAPFFERGEKMSLEYPIRNSHRAVGARVSSAIVRKWGDAPPPPDRLTVRLRGSAGQSLGAFAVQGLSLILTGDANDYVGKGLSGASITVRPGSGAPGAIIGNTCLYGATSGALYASGRAGERFAVRNSGADAVIEGCGANGCEYMTGGTVVVLGAIGDNFAAGMTGGEAFLHDPEDRAEDYVNPGSVRLADMNVAAQLRCRALLERHAAATGSARAAEILTDWEASATTFRWVAPLEKAADDDVDPAEARA